MIPAYARIGLVGPLPPPSGGMSNQTRQLAALLQRDGVRVELVRSNAPYGPSWIARVRYVRELFRFVPYVAALWRVAGRADLLHVMANSGWSWHLVAAPALWVGRLRGIPVVVNYRGGAAADFFARQFRVVRPTLGRAAAVVVPSAFLARVFARYGIASAIVPNIVDLAAFAHGSDIARERSGGTHVVVTRNLEHLYDIPTALRAFALFHRSHPGSRLTVAGTGPQRARLERLARELGIGRVVTFTGGLENAAIAKLYADATVMLNPSRVDNMPISILEALASGVPVVSTDAGGIPHLVQHERTALLVPPGAPDAMAQALARVADDAALADRLVEAGLALAQEYAWPRVRERLAAVYAPLLARAGGAAPAGAQP